MRKRQILPLRAVVSKRRSLFLWKGVRIHLDEIRDLGTFIELEALAASDAADRASHEARRGPIRRGQGGRGGSVVGLPHRRPRVLPSGPVVLGPGFYAFVAESLDLKPHFRVAICLDALMESTGEISDIVGARAELSTLWRPSDSQIVPGLDHARSGRILRPLFPVVGALGLGLAGIISSGGRTIQARR